MCHRKEEREKKNEPYFHSINQYKMQITSPSMYTNLQIFISYIKLAILDSTRN